MYIRFAVVTAGVALVLTLAGCDTLERLVKVPPAPVVTPAPQTKGGHAGGSVSAKSVMGRDEAGVTDLLGPPGAVRNEPPARVWQYAGTNCRFDVFFYFDVGNKDFRALSYKFIPDQKTLSAERTCLASIKKDQSR